jgi:hypothetical protein
LPSRDQLGTKSREGSVVRRRKRVPSAAISQISAFELSVTSNAISRPSGDHRGVPDDFPGNEVNCTAFEPPVSDFQISTLPRRSEANTMELPSGEICGFVSMRVEATASVSGPPSIDALRMLKSSDHWPYSTFLPSGDSAIIGLRSAKASSGRESPPDLLTRCQFHVKSMSVG